jgi:hypothetical protein
MTKEKVDKKNAAEKISEAFDRWSDALDTMTEQADKGYMPLLSSAFKHSKEILQMYRRAFVEGMKEEQE